jgi:hypothetical protein
MFLKLQSILKGNLQCVNFQGFLLFLAYSPNKPWIFEHWKLRRRIINLDYHQNIVQN